MRIVLLQCNIIITNVFILQDTQHPVESLPSSGYIRVTDKLLFGGLFTQSFFGNTQLFFKQGVSKSKGIIKYPIKIVDVT